MSAQFSDGDETIICVDCKNPFNFTTRDKAFYAEMKFKDKPKRCKPCRDARKAAKGDGQQDQNRAALEAQAQRESENVWAEEGKRRKGGRDRSR